MLFCKYIVELYCPWQRFYFAGFFQWCLKFPPSLYLLTLNMAGGKKILESNIWALEGQRSSAQ